jgi:Spy/CpxP family protein refolding chaperone
MRFRYAVTTLALIAATEALAQQPGYVLPRGLQADSAPERQCTPMGYFLYGVPADSATTRCSRSEPSAPDARSAQRRGPSSEDDPFAAYFFPPELIMAHQRELGLQDSQRAAMTSEIQKAQARFVELQWKMSAETERLKTLLAAPVVNEAQVLEQIDRTLAVEREIKRIQVALLVRIKNTLTPSQQATLAELRDNSYANSSASPNPGRQAHFRLGNIF